MQGCKEGHKQSTNLNYIPEVQQRGGTVLSCAPVHKVVFEGKRVIGIKGHFKHPLTRQKGGTFFVRAKKAVLIAASVTHSPLILKRSGVRTRAVGEFYRSHPGFGVLGVYDEKIDMHDGATQGWASLKYRDNPGLKLETLSLPLELVASRLPGSGPGLMERIREYPHMAMWVAAVRAETVGRIGTGLGGTPLVHYNFTKADMEKMFQAGRIIAEMHFEVGAKKVLAGTYGLPYALGPDDLHFIRRSTP